MTPRIQSYCAVGIVHFMMWKDTIRGEGNHRSVDTVLADPYFDAIEVTWIKNDAERARVAQLVKASGKALAFGGQPVLLTQKLDLNHLDEAERRKAVAAIVGVIPQAYELGARGLGVLSGKNVAPPDKARAMELLVKSLCEIAAELKRHGSIPLVRESFDQLTYGKNCLIGPNQDAAAIAREVRRQFPSFGLMLDLSHLPLQGQTPAQAWVAAGEYVVHAHIGNCVMETPGHPMNGDEHPPFGDPAGRNGIPELVEYLRVLKNAGYLREGGKKFLSFEVCVYGDWTQAKAVQHCKESLDAAWAQV